MTLAAADAMAQAAVEAARAAARENRNAQSARLFEQAIAQEPQRRRELLRELADQLTYSNRARDAIPLYEEVLGSPLSAGETLQARKGLGLALLWTDQPTRARAVFEQVLQQDEGDADASRNLGRALSWGGRQREAVAHLHQHVLRHPQDAEARVILAQAQAWMGRGDRAATSLQGVDREDAGRLRAQMAADQAPRTVLEGQRSVQSDDLRIDAWRVQHAVGLAQGRGMLGLRLERFDYEREDGSDSAQVSRPMLLGRWRFSDALEWNVEAGRERITAQGTPSSEFTAYSTWLTLWPHDVLRVDISSSRSDLDNLRSLRLGLTHQDHGLSTDFTPTERQRYTARWQQSRYSDGNARRWSEVEAEYRWWTHPDAWVGLKHTRFRFERLLNNGYFNPLHFESTQVSLRTRWLPAGDAGPWVVEARVALGRERADNEGDKGSYDVELRGRYRLDPQTSLVAHAQRFSSRTASSTGFARSTFGIRLERSW